MEHQGWKVIDLAEGKRVHARDVLKLLPERTFMGIDDIIESLAGVI
ncbi:MAG: hypothetical protein ACUVQ8_02510 [Nitrososphaeria archaeon]